MTTGRLVSKEISGNPVPAATTESASRSDASTAPLQGIVVVVLSKLRRAHWQWGWQRIAFGSWWPNTTPGLRFIKTLGSGKDGGFGLVPSLSHQGMFCVFDSEAEANDFVNTSALIARYRERLLLEEL